MDENQIEIDPGQLRRIQSMILASSYSDRRPSAAGEKGFLYDIVANGRNGIDTDKFDYLQRDARNCGIQVSCSFDRLKFFMRVIDDEICFKATEVDNIYELFQTRASMYRWEAWARGHASGRGGGCCQPTVLPAYPEQWTSKTTSKRCCTLVLIVPPSVIQARLLAQEGQGDRVHGRGRPGGGRARA